MALEKTPQNHHRSFVFQPQDVTRASEEQPMDLKEMIQKKNHEQVVAFNDSGTGLFGFIAIHDTTLGPALGGCRMWPYDNTEQALIDALRLSRGMTYKASLAGLNLGGGKAVIIGDSKKNKSEELFRAFGQFVDSLGGRYITAEDVGTTVQDMVYVMAETRHVVGGPRDQGGSGDPSPFTAFGTLQGIKASLKFTRNTTDLTGVTVAIQGVGSVGSHLVSLLVAEGAKVFVSDIDDIKVRRVVDANKNVEAVSPDDIISLDVDIFSPCAMGAVINDASLDKIKTKIIAGAANNQLKEDRHGEILAKKGILYAPDYCINAGGLINVYLELFGYDPEKAKSMTSKIYDTLLNIYQTAKDKNIPNSKAADHLAMERIQRVKHLKGKSYRSSFRK